jgi:hypothetical protein
MFLLVLCVFACVVLFVDIFCRTKVEQPPEEPAEPQEDVPLTPEQKKALRKEKIKRLQAAFMKWRITFVGSILQGVSIGINFDIDIDVELALAFTLTLTLAYELELAWNWN